MPPFGDFLVCGISTQLQQTSQLDEIISRGDADFSLSGLKATSLIRLGFLAVLPKSEFKGRIGSVSSDRHSRLLAKLAEHLRP
jgi:mRNA interferase MazF